MDKGVLCFGFYFIFIVCFQHHGEFFWTEDLLEYSQKETLYFKAKSEF